MRTTSREFRRNNYPLLNKTQKTLREAAYFSAARGDHCWHTEPQRCQGTSWGSGEMMGWANEDEPSESQSQNFNKKGDTQTHLLRGIWGKGGKSCISKPQWYYTHCLAFMLTDIFHSFHFTLTDILIHSNAFRSSSNLCCKIFFLKVKHSYWYSFRADGPQQQSPNTHAQ